MYYADTNGIYGSLLRIEKIKENSKNSYRCKILVDYIPVEGYVEPSYRDKTGLELNFNEYFMHDTFEKAVKSYLKENLVEESELIKIIFKWFR